MIASRISAVIAPLTMWLPSSRLRESGAARSRFHRPRRRASSTPTPTSMPMKRMNCTPMPANEWA